MTALRIFSIASVLVMCACADPVVEIQLSFPSEDAFLRSNTASLDIFSGDTAGACDALLANPNVAPPGAEAAAASGVLDVCAFDKEGDGGVVFEKLPLGKHAFFAQVYSGSNDVILRGCTIQEVAATREEDPTPVVISMAKTSAFVDDDELTCANAQDKCQEKTPCL